MRIVLQRVSQASVTVDNSVVGQIGPGVVLLVGLAKSDSIDSIERSIEKIVTLRIFSDEGGRFQHSLIDVAGQALLISQFTLLADTSKGRRPDFFAAMEPIAAKQLYEKYLECFRVRLPGKVETGIFGASMHVSLINDGPVSLVLDF